MYTICLMCPLHNWSYFSTLHRITSAICVEIRNNSTTNYTLLLDVMIWGNERCNDDNLHQNCWNHLVILLYNHLSFTFPPPLKYFFFNTKYHYHTNFTFFNLTVILLIGPYIAGFQNNNIIFNSIYYYYKLTIILSFLYDTSID